MTPEQFVLIAPALPVDRRVTYTDPLIAAMARFEITGHLREAAFLAQLMEESQLFTHWVENMFYTHAEHIREVFGMHRFPTVASAAPYVRNPEKLGNHVYANRGGNGDEASGDGFKFRGHGPIQATFFEMYEKLDRALSLGCVANPDVLTEPVAGFLSAAWIFATEKRCLPLADANTDEASVIAITHRINGGSNGLADRRTFYKRCRKVLG